MAGFKSRQARSGFSLPFANLDSTRVDREWRHVKVQDLQEGDTVAGMGLVVSVQPTCRGEIAVEAGVPDARTHFIDESDTVKAFVKKES